MTVTSADVLSRHLKPLCSRDNHVMKYESGGSRANTGDRASYHCGIAGCSVRYSSTDGYVEVSRFEAKLPLRSAKVVSLRAKHRIEREDAEPTRFFVVPSRGAHAPVRRTGSAHPRRQRF